MRRAGWIQVDAQGRPKKDKTNGKAKPRIKIEPEVDTGPNSIYYRSALKDECAALAVMPPNSGRNNARSTVPLSTSSNWSPPAVSTKTRCASAYSPPPRVTC
jgi:hypothetical protein